MIFCDTPFAINLGSNNLFKGILFTNFLQVFIVFKKAMIARQVKNKLLTII